MNDTHGVQIDMRGVPVGPYDLGKHVHGEGWVWFDGKHFRWPRSRWRWLCAWRNRRLAVPGSSPNA